MVNNTSHSASESSTSAHYAIRVRKLHDSRTVRSQKGLSRGGPVLLRHEIDTQSMLLALTATVVL